MRPTIRMARAAAYLALWSPECIWSRPLHRRARRRPPRCSRADPPGRAPPSYSARDPCSRRWQGWAREAQTEDVSYAPSWKGQKVTDQPVAKLSKTLTAGLFLSFFKSAYKMFDRIYQITHLCCLMFCMENLFAGSYSSIPEKQNH